MTLLFISELLFHSIKMYIWLFEMQVQNCAQQYEKHSEQQRVKYQIEQNYDIVLFEI